MSNYVRLLLSELFIEMRTEAVGCYKEAEIDNDLLDKIIAYPKEEQGGLNYEN